MADLTKDAIIDLINSEGRDDRTALQYYALADSAINDEDLDMLEASMSSYPDMEETEEVGSGIEIPEADSFSKAGHLSPRKKMTESRKTAKITRGSGQKAPIRPFQSCRQMEKSKCCTGR